MSQAERFYEIDRILKTHRVVPLSRFMEELRVSRATIIRDLTYLKDRLRAPIVWDRDLRGYRLDGPSTLPAIYLNSAEIHALLVLHQLVTRIQPSFLDEQVRPLRDLIRKLIAKEDSGADEVGQRIGRQHGAGRLQDCLSHDALQLTDVAWPGVGQQLAQGIRRDSVNFLAQFA
jgi:predicted DNA-binding transcriptional regulator YafY